MKNLTVSFGLLLCSVISLGQEETSKNASELVLYSNFDFKASELIINNDTTNELMIKNSQTIGALSFAFRKTINEKWSRELLIQNVNLFSVTDEIVTIINPQGQPQITHGYRSQTSGLGLGLEAHRQIGNGDGKLNFRLGGMTSLNFSHQNFSPKISTIFPFRTSQFGVGLSVIPRVEYRINSRCNFSLSAFLPFMELGFNQTTSENPRISEVQRRVSTTDLNLFENPTHFRFGLAYKLSPKEEE